MVKTMKAKYRGRDARTGVAIYPGDEIQYDTITRQAWITGEPGDCRVDTVTFNDQGVYRTFTRNARGRCIDAPCCGCCTI
jgi:hypothetical protein